MSKLIFNLELDGQEALCFDTALNAQSFAQAKMAHVITSFGTVVYPDGKTEKWQPGGVLERSGTMLVWGPFFPGESLLEILDDPDRRDEALDAIRFWLKARMSMEESPYPGPAGAIVVTGKTAPGTKYPIGTILFPPARLLRRILDAEGDAAVLDAARFVHPGLEGSGELSFSSGAMLYRVFCGAPPFTGNNRDELADDIREAVFIPPRLAAPGLNPEMAELISRSMGRVPQKGEADSRSPPEQIGSAIGPPLSRAVSSWLTPLKDEELLKIRIDLEQHRKKSGLKVKTRRFVRRNTAIIAAVLLAIIVSALIARGQIKRQADLPSTRGMEPAEVAMAYYGAFGDLDHTLMDACVSGKAGKGDIETVVNLYVISRMRQAYEMDLTAFMPAQKWIDAGRPPGDMTVFGVTDLRLNVLSMDREGGKAEVKADYTLWVPGAFFGGDENDEAVQLPPGTADAVPLPPKGIERRDTLALAFQKGMWRITEIERESKD